MIRLHYTSHTDAYNT